MKKIFAVIITVTAIMLIAAGCRSKTETSEEHKGYSTAAVLWAEGDDASHSVYVDFENRMIVTDNENIKEEVPQDVLDEMSDLFDHYIPVIREKEKEYWPETDEYPAMLQLFGVEFTYTDGSSYSQDGALIYPDGWDDFTGQLLSLCAEEG